MSEWQTVTKKTKNPNSKPDPDAYQPAYQTENDTVVFHKNKPATTTVLKSSAPNKGGNMSGSKFHKIDNSTSSDTIKKVSLSTAQLLNKALVEKKWSQKDLVANVGGRAGVNAQDIQKIARGEAIANDAKLTAIENTINMRLRGKLAGEPIRKVKNQKTNK
jgi:ribosome-binding protein aMBF1 (putative translation factor)